jgi:hypothetical protein
MFSGFSKAVEEGVGEGIKNALPGAIGNILEEAFRGKVLLTEDDFLQIVQESFWKGAEVGAREKHDMAEQIIEKNALIERWKIKLKNRGTK